MRKLLNIALRLTTLVYVIEIILMGFSLREYILKGYLKKAG